MEALMTTADSAPPIPLWKIGPQQLVVDFDGGHIVSDAGLLSVRSLDKQLGILAELAERLPDPRSQKFVHHTAEALLTQEVYQILAGYGDCQDAQTVRVDPLFQILTDVAPDPDQPLASGSTLARFHYAYTRRDSELPREERPALLEQRAAQTGRIKIVNDFLVDLFIRTRRTPPTELIIDLDPTDDPTHGQQVLSGYHGYYRQHQYLPLLAFEGTTGFPLAAWLRPGTAHASWGAVDVLHAIVTKLRAAWPDVLIRVRGDNGVAVRLATRPTTC
jgi:DDE family transposase